MSINLVKINEDSQPVFSEDLLLRVQERIKNELPKELINILKVTNGGNLIIETFKIQQKLIKMNKLFKLSETSEINSIVNLVEFHKLLKSDISIEKWCSIVDPKDIIIFGTHSHNSYFCFRYNHDKLSPEPEVVYGLIRSDGIDLQCISSCSSEFFSSYYDGDEFPELTWNPNVPENVLLNKSVIIKALNQNKKFLIHLQCLLLEDYIYVRSAIEYNHIIIDVIHGKFILPKILNTEYSAEINHYQDFMDNKFIERKITSFKNGRYFNYLNYGLTILDSSTNNDAIAKWILRICDSPENGQLDPKDINYINFKSELSNFLNNIRSK